MDAPGNNSPTPDVPTPEIKVDPFNDDLPANREPVCEETLTACSNAVFMAAGSFSIAVEQLILAIGWKRAKKMLDDLKDGWVCEVQGDQPSLHYQAKRLFLQIPLDPHCRSTRQQNAIDALDDARSSDETEGR